MDSKPEQDQLSASDQIRAELHAVFRRYGQESGITVYQCLGVMECVKIDLWEMLERSRNDR